MYSLNKKLILAALYLFPSLALAADTAGILTSVQQSALMEYNGSTNFGTNRRLMRVTTR